MQPHVIEFVILLILSWMAAIWFAARLSGWNRLAEKFRCEESPLAPWKGWGWARLGIASYKGCLWWAVDQKGLYLKTGPLFLFRICHSPLRIPWSGIKSIIESHYWWIETLEIELFDPNVKIMLKRHSLDDARRYWQDKLVQSGKSN